MSPGAPILSVVLPCYEEAATLPALLKAYDTAVPDGLAVELVVVDNGSTDGTDAALAALSHETWRFRLAPLTLSPNRGYGGGILAGLRAARGGYLAWSHADMQTPASDVFALYAAVQARPDPARCFGKGRRVNDRGAAARQSLWHARMARLVLGLPFEEINAQPKLFHRDFLARLEDPPSGYELDLYACHQALRDGMEIVTVDVAFLPRQAGHSKWAISAMGRVRFAWRNLIYLFRLLWSRR